MYQAQLSIALSVIADQWEDVRITTEMLLWGSPVHKKEEKVVRKEYVKGCLKGTHIHVLNLVSKCWHLCDDQACAVTPFCHSYSWSSPQVFWNPQKVSRSGGSSLHLLLHHHARHWQHQQHQRSQHAQPDTTWVVMGYWAPWWKVPTVCSC